MDKRTSHDKIAQITWITYTNYGTFLQAFALQQVLKQLGFNSALIDDSRYVGAIVSMKGRLLSLLSSIYHRTYFKNKRQKKLYRSFADSFLTIDRNWIDYKDLNNRYNTFICGSDQIWSPLLPNHHDGFYFASFASESAKNIAYAPSLGSKTYSAEYATLTSKWISKFSFLSARESSGAKILSEISGKNDVATVIDPTLLLPSKDWIEFEKKNTTTSSKLQCRPYLLTYFLTRNSKYFDAAKRIAKEKGLLLVSLNSLPNLHNDFDVVLECGPMEFLSAIANAHYVITDSFHGTIFAIHFHRPFLTFKRFATNAANSQNARVENLFEKLEIKDNFLGEDDPLRLPQQPNWKRISELLDIERSHSLNYLKSALQ